MEKKLASSSAVPVLLMADTLYEIAGSERNLYEIVTRIDPLRYRPIVIAFKSGNMLALLRKRGIEAIDLGLRRIYSPDGIRRIAWLYRMMRSRGVRIIVSYHEGSDYVASVVGRLAGVPIIISSRRDMGYNLERRHVAMYRLINRLFDRIIVVSGAVREAVIRREGVPSDKLVTIYNGVDIERFQKDHDRGKIRASLGLPATGPVVGVLAVLRPIKGHEYFLRAAASVARQIPDARFLLVGWCADRSYFTRLQGLVRELGIADRTIFAGGRMDVPEMLSVIDVPVFSSINEGFSNAVVECMAAGKPVVATRGGGTPEAVIDGETGILVPPRDSGTLADAVLSLLKDPARAAAMGSRGRERARGIFTLDRMISEVEGLFDALLREKRLIAAPRVRVSGMLLLRAGYGTAKQSLGGVLYYSGITRRIMQHHPGVRILGYHRVNDDHFVLPGMCVSVRNFEEQMKYLKRNFNVVALEAVADAFERGHALPYNSVAVTFDDGYRDNFLHAFPVLARHGIPATVFLSVAAIDGRSALWFDRVMEAFRRTSCTRVDLRRFGLRVYDLGSGSFKVRCADDVIQYLKTVSAGDRDSKVRELAEELKVSWDDLQKLSTMLDWDDVRHMNKEGISFGSHGMSHSILTKVPADALEYEIAESKRIIVDRTGIDARTFSYPNGNVGDFSDDMGILLRRHGYAAAVTLVKGYNHDRIDLYALRRFCVTEGMGASMFGGFSKARFAAVLSGVYR